jgi:hypothetical protein
MASQWKQLLEEELEQLGNLQELMRAERECLLRMDREALMRVTREKEALALRMRGLNTRKESLEEQDRDSLTSSPRIRALFQTRNTLLREVREMSRVQKEIVDAQREQVGQLLGFLQNLRTQSSTYDATGKYK